jgi:hypothetical protein
MNRKTKLLYWLPFSLPLGFSSDVRGPLLGDKKKAEAEYKPSCIPDAFGWR